MKNTRARILLGPVAAFLLITSLVAGCGDDSSNDRGSEAKVESAKLVDLTVRPHRVEGAPFPAEPPSKIEEQEHDESVRVPDGPRRGELAPTNPATELEEGGQAQQSVTFTGYKDVSDPTPPASDTAEISVAEHGGTVIMTGNWFVSFSFDGGGSFKNINPTTIFPQDDGGFCCDQVVDYVPRYDLFVWLLQYSGSPNRIRIAAAKSQAVRDSNGTAWTYWDFTSTALGHGTLDYNDMSFGQRNLYWTTQNGDGRVVVRLPLEQLANGSSVNGGSTGGTDALWSHLTHNASDTVYWAGHINSSQMRVFAMKDADNVFTWRTVDINSWPNGVNKELGPDGTTNIMDFEDSKHYVFGNTLAGNDVWFSWLASSNEHFPHPHVQMVKIDTSTFKLVEQDQIWNPDFAFQDAFLSTNDKGDLGMDVAFGGKPFHESDAVGVWGDFVVYYPRLSIRSVTRWGDYNTVRRSSVNPSTWVSAGYVLDATTAVPHYIQFSH